MWTKLIREDDSTYPPPYKRLLFCFCQKPPANMYAPRPFEVRVLCYDLFSGVYLPDSKGKIKLFDDYEREVTSRVQYWQLAPEPPVEINDTFEETFTKETV